MSTWPTTPAGTACRSGSPFSPAAIAAADKTLAERKPKPFAALVRRCRKPTDTPAAGRWEMALRATLAARSPAVAHRLVTELVDIAAATTIVEEPQLAAGLVALLSHEGQQIRDLADWRPATHNAERQFAALARHLFEPEKVPEKVPATKIGDTGFLPRFGGWHL